MTTEDMYPASDQIMYGDDYYNVYTIETINQVLATAARIGSTGRSEYLDINRPAGGKS